MDRRVDNAIGALAGVTAVTTIAVFGYLTATTPGPGLGWIGGSPSAAPVVAPKMAARGEIVDADYKFKLVAPKPKWRVFDRAASDEIFHDTNAVMLSDTGMVSLGITRVGAISMEVAELIVKDDVGVSGAEAKPIRWIGREAVELTFDTQNPRRERFFLRDGYLYRYAIISYEGTPGITEADYPGLWGSLSLADGELAPGPFAPAPRDRRGSDWQVDAGRWQSATAGLAVTAPAGWRMLVGRALREGRTEADLELVDTVSDCHVAIYAATTMKAFPEDTPRITAEILGARRELVEIPRVDRVMWSVQLDVDGTAVLIDTWAPAADRERGLIAIRGVLAAIDKLSAAERAALAADFAAHPYAATAIGEDWVDRNGTFVHYTGGVVWTRPQDQVWRVLTPPRAEANLEGAVVVAQVPRSDVSFGIVPQDAGASSTDAATWLAEASGLRVKPVDLTALRPGLEGGAEVTWVDAKVSQVHQVGTLVGDNGRTVRVHVWGAKAAVAASRERIASALSGFGTVTVKPVDEDGEYMHRRMGIAIDLPGWNRRRLADSADYLNVRWNHADEELFGISAEHVGSATSELLLAQVMTLSSAAVSAGADFSPKRQHDKIGGLPATRVSWFENGIYVAALLVERHEMVYTIFVRGTEATLQTVKRAIRFVDPA